MTVEFEFLPWSRALFVANSSRYHGTAIWNCTDYRKQRFLFSAPLIPFRYVFYHIVSEPLIWNQLADITGKTIGLTQDYAYGSELEHAIAQGAIKVERTSFRWTR